MDEAGCAKKPFIPEIDLSQGSDSDLAEQIHHSLSTLGFACLKSTSLWRQTEEYAKKARNFFQLSEKDKIPFLRLNGSNQGWLPKCSERLNPERPSDYKECYTITLSKYHANQISLPPELYEDDAREVMKTFTELSYRVMHLIGLGLKLKDPDFIMKTHNYGQPDNQTTLGINFYPPLLSEETGCMDSSIVKGQVRCGEHTDWGSVTLLYTDSPGLEVLNRSNGEYTSCGQKSGAIYLNIGDLLQFWSDDILIANKHRVMIPREEEFLKSERMSIAFFCQPDDDVEIRSLTGVNKYPPVTSGDWLQANIEAAAK